LWSQDQLAKASGLGLRTIQRLESEGRGSQESIRALAAVFEVTPEDLVWRDGSFRCYFHRQWGLITFAIVPILLAFILLVEASNRGLPDVVLVAICVLLGLVLIIFSSMTIQVNENEICWYFGPGIFRKRVLLEEIDACTKVRNPIWMGFGIHGFGTGWIYNVSGLLGVELALKSGAFIRLGTDEPNYLVHAIEDALDNAG